MAELERYYSAKHGGHVLHRNGRKIALVPNYKDAKEIIESINGSSKQ